MCEVATMLISKVSRILWTKPIVHLFFLWCSYKLWILSPHYFDMTAPVAETRRLSGLSPATVDRNEQVNFHWTPLICFPRVCGFTSIGPDMNPEVAAEQTLHKLTSYQHNFPHFTNTVLFQDSLRKHKSKVIWILLLSSVVL